MLLDTLTLMSRAGGKLFCQLLQCQSRPIPSTRLGDEGLTCIGGGDEAGIRWDDVVGFSAKVLGDVGGFGRSGL